MTIAASSLSYNTHLFGGTIPATLGGQDFEDEIRMGRILSHIAQLSPTIVCLQEAWADSTRRWFCEHATGAGYVFNYFQPDEPDLKISSGLLVLSKWALDHSSFTHFKASAGQDWWATKGYIAVTARKTRGVSLSFLVTHTQAHETEHDKAARKQQFQQIATEISKMGAGPILLCGDFNVIAEAKGGALKMPEYIEMDRILNTVGMLDCFRIANPYTPSPVRPGYTYDLYANLLGQYFDPQGHPPEQRLDYFYAKLAGMVVTKCQVLNQGWVYPGPEPSSPLMDLSDHYPLYMEFKLPTPI